VQKAKEHASQGRLEAAASAYHKALERQPDNWLLLCEVANFLNFGLRDPQAGLEMARAGLALNPSCSADLWNAYGDCLFSLGRIGESRHAFEQALQINPEDVAARYNLAWVFLHRKEHAKALEVIAEALAKDWRGEYRDRLLQKQTEVLVDLARRRRQEFQAVLDRVSHHPTPPARNPMKGETKLEVRPS
jgi:tetratricopeptide (TPR) repeat protein